MARDGFRIFDSDTHVGPSMNVLDSYMAAAEKARLTDWEQWKDVNPRSGRITYTRGSRQYQRRLGSAAADPAPGRYMAAFTGANRARPSPRVDEDPAARIADMDLEGVDVNLTLPSGWFGTWTADDYVGLEMAMYRAYHRWMADYCGAFSERLGGVILVSARDIDGSLAEIRRWARSRWAWAVMAYAPAGMPLDHPDIEPIWAAAAEHDLAVVLHTFTVMPPYAPGGEDTWGNLFLQRSAAHPWCGMRNMAALIGSGVILGLPFHTGVDVLGVLAEDDGVELLGIFHRARRALEIAHGTQADVEVEQLAQRDVERADTAAHRRRQRSFDPDQIFLERLDGFVGQPGVELVERFLARPHFHPRDLTLAAVNLLEHVVEDILRGAPDVGPGAVTLDKRNDRPRRHVQLAVRPHRDLLAVARNLDRLERHLP